MKIKFWGATDDVTGSMTILESKNSSILIDCGLAQGPKETEKINYLSPPVDPKQLSAILITHAHLDHSGFLPRLIQKGFKGAIYCTAPTAKLVRIILLDSSKLNEEFYNEDDVQRTLHLIKIINWEETFEIHDIECRFVPAGHILGASTVLLKSEGKTVAFSGDLGRNEDPLLLSPSPCPKSDVVIMESTYGNKIRTSDIKEDLAKFLKTISTQDRVGIIASFAVARGQNILTLINEIFNASPSLKVRVVMDSPMMKEANKVYQQYSHLTQKPESLFSALDKTDAIEYQKEWDSLKNKKGPLIILSSSGMLTGGRVSRHLENWQDDEKAILFLPGYQGEGTPGRAFLEGNRAMKNRNGETFLWKGEVWSSEAFSSHADQSELMKWVLCHNADSDIYLIHGEEMAKSVLKNKLENAGASKVYIPKRGSLYVLKE